MFINISFTRHFQIDGDTLRAFTTTFIWKHLKGTRLIAEPNGKKVKDWAIRSQAPKFVKQEYGEGSTTKW